MRLNELKKLINETIQEEKRASNSFRKKGNWGRVVENIVRKVLNEAEGDENSSGKSAASSWNASTDINGKGEEIQKSLQNDPETLYNVICTATSWAKGALKKKGITDGATLQAAAKEMWGDDYKTIKELVTKMTELLNAAGGFEKREMPALELKDAKNVADALNADQGDFGVDFEKDFKDNEADFDDWYQDQDKKAEKQNSSRYRDGNVILERWSKLAGLITEIADDPRFPYPGDHKVMDGAPNQGETGDAVSIGDLSGKAKAFVTKGKGTGDKIEVSTEKTCKIGEMKPTQKNVKLAKSLLFAFVQDAKKNEEDKAMGAYLAEDGADKWILDGHHRWSGQFLKNNLDADMNSLVTIVKPSSLKMDQFLTMLTVLGNALGRPTKK